MKASPPHESGRLPTEADHVRLRETRRASGAVAVEMAFVLPIMFLILFGIVVGGMGVFRYQEVAALAREGARYASVRGTEYVRNNPGATAATQEDILQNVVRARAAGMDLSRLSCTVTWDQTNAPATVVSNAQPPVGNRVTVTVTYRWFPEWFLVGPINLSSSSTMAMSY
jgi:Flp pilus assembly protein TadG